MSVHRSSIVPKASRQLLPGMISEIASPHSTVSVPTYAIAAATIETTRPSPPLPIRSLTAMKTACAAPTASTCTAVENAQRYGMHLPARIRHQIRSSTATRIASAGWSTTAAAIIQAGARSLCSAPPRRRRLSTRRAPSTAISAETVSAKTTSRPRQLGSSVKACTPYPMAARSTSTTTANAGTVRVHSAQCRIARLLCATITPHGTSSKRLVPIRDGALWMTMWKRRPTVENSVV